MPKKLVSEADILKAWEKKRERDKKAQATWVAKNKEVHLQRMREQYVKKVPTAKEKAMKNLDEAPKRKLRTQKEQANSLMMAMEDRDAPKNKRKLKK